MGFATDIVMTRTLIVIPARFGSSRFPGKPLAKINGKAMVEHVAEQARAATQQMSDSAYVVATDDQRIKDHCARYDIPIVMTDPALPSGSDRALKAAQIIAPECEFVINLQGDAPYTPVDHIITVVNTLIEGTADVATPCIQLTWEALDQLRKNKTTTPHSGTTCVADKNGKALWFSKQIIPSLRNEEAVRKTQKQSPVLRHIGLYGFRRKALERFTSLPQSHFEKLEGLEQLRLLENGMTIDVAVVEPPAISTSGIDTPEDIKRLEILIEENRK